MPRVMNEPYFDLLTKNGRHDIRWAIKNWGLDWDLVVDIKDHTWFGIKFKLKRIKK